MLNRNRWNLAFFEKQKLVEVLKGDCSAIRWLRYPDTSRWFADPFILDYNDDVIVVLAEELSYGLNKGRIARLEIDRHKMRLAKMEILLELSTHLSFPMIFRHKSCIYVLPENSASGKTDLYTYNEQNRGLTKVATLADLPLTDATIFEHNQKLWLYGTQIPNANGAKLDIYEVDEFSWTLRKKQSKMFDSNIARNAGIPFKYNGKLIRPAQDCNGQYGRGVILQEIKFNEGNLSWEFHQIGKLYPFTFNYHLGLHTLNEYKGLCVIDARGLLHPYFGRLVRPLIDSAKKILHR